MSIKDSVKKKKIKRPLAARVFSMVIMGSLTIGIIMLLVGVGSYLYVMAKQNVDTSLQIADSARDYVVSSTDPAFYANKVKKVYDSLSDEEKAGVGTMEYYAKFSDVTGGSGYMRMLSLLKSYSKSEAVDDVYFAYIDEKEGRLIYIADPDTRIGKICPAGHWEKLRKREILRFRNADFDKGSFDFGFTEKYGWICTSGVPVTSRDGVRVGFIFADITVGGFLETVKWFAINFSVILLVLMIILSLLITHRMKKKVITPINDIADAAKAYVKDKESNEEKTDHFASLGISTGDEIQNLSEVMADMEQGLNDYEENLARVTSEKEKMAVELDLAKKIQNDMLPNVFPPFPERRDFDIYASMDPAKEVGGDFYDFFLVDDSHVAMTIADVSGKGIPAALFMMVTKSILQNVIIEGMSPGPALSTLNSRICEGEHEGMFVTVWLGILDLKTGKLTCSNAGHEYPVLKHHDGDFELIKDKHCFVVGGISGIQYKEYELTLEPGSKLFVYTDGIPEATNINDEMFGTDRMIEAINTVKDGSAKEIVDVVKNKVVEFAGEAEQFDDMTMMCLDYRGVEEGKSPVDLKEVETLIDMTLPAEIQNQPLITERVDEALEKLDCPFKTQAQIDIAIDELFSNIAKYAYAPGKGSAGFRMELERDTNTVILTFTDSGTPYDPVAQEDPDITLSAEERGIGGLGILMVKKSMDDLRYEYRDGKNILKLRKKIE